VSKTTVDIIKSSYIPPLIDCKSLDQGWLKINNSLW